MFEFTNNNLIASSIPNGLEQFTIFKRFDSFRINRCFRIENYNGLKIIEVKTFNEFAIHSEGRSMDREVNSIHIFAMFNLNWDSKGFYLKPETLTDKIIDSIIHQDIDFASNKKFSSKFRIIGNDKNLLKEKISNDFMNYTTQLEYLEMEVIKQKGIMCISELPVSKKLIFKTIEVGKKIIEILNK